MPFAWLPKKMHGAADVAANTAEDMEAEADAQRDGEAQVAMDAEHAQQPEQGEIPEERWDPSSLEDDSEEPRCVLICHPHTPHPGL